MKRRMPYADTYFYLKISWTAVVMKLKVKNFKFLILDTSRHFNKPKSNPVGKNKF